MNTLNIIIFNPNGQLYYNANYWLWKFLFVLLLALLFLQGAYRHHFYYTAENLGCLFLGFVALVLPYQTYWRLESGQLVRVKKYAFLTVANKQVVLTDDSLLLLEISPCWTGIDDDTRGYQFTLTLNNDSLNSYYMLWDEKSDALINKPLNILVNELQLQLNIPLTTINKTSN